MDFCTGSRIHKQISVGDDRLGLLCSPIGGVPVCSLLHCFASRLWHRHMHQVRGFFYSCCIPHWYNYMPYYRGMAYSDRI